MKNVIDEVKIQVWKFADQEICFNLWWVSYHFGKQVTVEIESEILDTILNQIWGTLQEKGKFR